jgi:hypothetical protein
MADDALVEGEGASEAAAPAAKPKAASPHMALRIVLGTAGLLLVVGFFLPWVQIGDNPQISGLSLVIDDTPDIRNTIGETQRWILLVVPAFGVALTAIGFMGFRWSGPVGAVLGLLLLGYGAVTTVIIFFQSTRVGLWLIVAGAFLALGSGVLVWVRARFAKRAALAEAPPVE